VDTRLLHKHNVLSGAHTPDASPKIYNQQNPNCRSRDHDSMQRRFLSRLSAAEGNVFFTCIVPHFRIQQQPAITSSGREKKKLPNSNTESDNDVHATSRAQTRILPNPSRRTSLSSTSNRSRDRQTNMPGCRVACITSRHLASFLRSFHSLIDFGPCFYTSPGI
jgi:hypothetical protein